MPSLSTTSTRRSRLSAIAAAGLRLSLVGFVAATVLSPTLGLAPEPDPVPRRWQLEVETGPLRVATVNVQGVGPRTYMYMSYRVVNNSGQDLLFAPLFELSIGNGQNLRSGREVPQAVVGELLATFQNPLMQDQISIVGDLLQGGENAKDGLVVWPLKDLNPGKVTIYGAGFSGETKTVVSLDGKQSFVLRKTLMLEFDTPGNLEGQKAEPIPLRARSWIMR